jgi:hypothetical protein
MTSNNNLNLETAREYIMLVVAIITAIAGLIFWVQNVDKDKIDRLERDIELIQADIDNL